MCVCPGSEARKIDKGERERERERDGDKGGLDKKRKERGAE